MVSSVSVDPATPNAGQPVTVSVKVANQGLNPAGAFRVDWSPSVGAPAIPRQVAGLGGGCVDDGDDPVRLRSAGTFDSLATVGRRQHGPGDERVQQRHRSGCT